MESSRYQISLYHGESRSLWQIVDTSRPESEQPVIVATCPSQEIAQAVVDDLQRQTAGKVALGTPLCDLANITDEAPRVGWLADAHAAFRNDSAAALHSYLRHLRFYRREYLNGRLTG